MITMMCLALWASPSARAVVPASNAAARSMNGMAPRTPNKRIVLSPFFQDTCELQHKNILLLNYTGRVGGIGEYPVKILNEPGHLRARSTAKHYPPPFRGRSKIAKSGSAWRHNPASQVCRRADTMEVK